MGSSPKEHANYRGGAGLIATVCRPHASSSSSWWAGVGCYPGKNTGGGPGEGQSLFSTLIVQELRKPLSGGRARWRQLESGCAAGCCRGGAREQLPWGKLTSSCLEQLGTKTVPSGRSPARPCWSFCVHRRSGNCTFDEIKLYIQLVSVHFSGRSQAGTFMLSERADRSVTQGGVGMGLCPFPQAVSTLNPRWADGGKGIKPDLSRRPQARRQSALWPGVRRALSSLGEAVLV